MTLKLNIHKKWDTGATHQGGEGKRTQMKHMNVSVSQEKTQKKHLIFWFMCSLVSDWLHFMSANIPAKHGVRLFLGMHCKRPFSEHFIDIKSQFNTGASNTIYLSSIPLIVAAPFQWTNMTCTEPSLASKWTCVYYLLLFSISCQNGCRQDCA